MRTLLASLCLTLLGFGWTSVQAADRFEEIKSRLAEAGCVQLEFLSIVDSRVFDVVDSVYGVAAIAEDGRFNVAVGIDQYIYDGTHLYSYNEDANQVIIEEPRDSLFVGSEIAFVTRLDDLYETSVLIPDKEYLLTKKTGPKRDVPDSVTVRLSEEGQLASLSYLDVNEDPNTVVILTEQTNDRCPPDSFLPDFPESAERVKL